jgi:DNA modification methylase
MNGEQMNYDVFLQHKLKKIKPIGIDVDRDSINDMLFGFQKDLVKWALKNGRSAIFADCGLGKTPMQLEWANQIVKKTGENVLLLAPLAVSKQTEREAKKFNIENVNIAKSDDDVQEGITITNYEKLHKFDLSKFGGVVLDESSILKSYTSKTRTQLIDSFQSFKYRLACSATPSPNDFMELGNHTEFLGICSREEMLAEYFIHDSSNTQKWRLKKHAEKEFWRFVAGWAAVIEKPSDLGYEDEGFSLPELCVTNEVVEPDEMKRDGLFFEVAQTLSERRDARKESIEDRVKRAADIANSTEEPVLVWCDLNYESKMLTDSIPDAVEITGSDADSHKENAMMDFTDGKIRVLVTKPSIAGFGMNWQHCRKMIFVGLSDSYEAYYQAVRRCWRFGQKSDVDVHVITSIREGRVVENINKKDERSRQMVEMVKEFMPKIVTENKGLSMTGVTYEQTKEESDKYKIYLGDCVDVYRELDDESIGYSIFSPPFSSLYTYSDSERDMGNARSDDEFYNHFKFLVKELYRVTKPGRLLSFHCMNLPTSKARDGVIGLKDFRGDLIRLFQDEGWIYHSEVTIWKDPVVAMQRTKALGLLWKQLKKDSCRSRQGIPDYLVTMRKPGVNPEPVGHKPEEFPVHKWQEIASPVWMDINQSDVLKYREARDDRDERHICPLQLEVIRRGMYMWSNPGDWVSSPFMGIGSEGYIALEMGRNFIGSELKRSYFDIAVKNIKFAAGEYGKQKQLFG